MKKHSRTITAIFPLVFAAGLCAWAQYSIDWYTIDGGGETSTGTQYTVSGTIGQPDAGKPMVSGPYSLTGGFWAIYAVQTPGAPRLDIVVSGLNQATVSWEPNHPGWMLQETPSLAPPSWTDSPSGTTNPVVVPTTSSEQFYRLFNP